MLHIGSEIMQIIDFGETVLMNKKRLKNAISTVVDSWIEIADVSIQS